MRAVLDKEWGATYIGEWKVNNTLTKGGLEMANMHVEWVPVAESDGGSHLQAVWTPDVDTTPVAPATAA